MNTGSKTTNHNEKGRSARHAGRGGFTLIELMVALSVAAIGMLGFSQAIIAAVALNESSQEEALARAGACEMLESFKGVPFAEVFSRFNASELDDPLGGLVVSRGFLIEGLSPQEDDNDGFVGEIEFPSIFFEDGSEQLREDVVDAGLSTPRDLNGDNIVDDVDHADDYILIPVRVRVSWRGPGGDASLEFRTILSGL
jgi:prepilin-type N-terminal cleavage/methylation domain-containing protein